MKKTDIKSTLNEIAPDAYLETRLKAKVGAYSPQKASNLKKLTAIASACCCIALALAVAIGAGREKSPEYIQEGNITLNQASPENGGENTDKTTKDVALTNPAWLNNTTVSIDNSGTKLLVNGEDITDDNYIKFSESSDYADISLTAVIEALGGKINWINKETASVDFNGKQYVLGARFGTFCLEGSNENLFTDEDGVNHANPQIINNQLVMDNLSVENLLNNLGYSVKIDFENRVIEIF